ncbi:MAG: hypothetical protein ACI9T9_000890 [Oleiphilaceae bacterium]
MCQKEYLGGFQISAELNKESKQQTIKDKRADAIRPAPSNKLSIEEESAILDACNQPEHASLPPSQIVPELLDGKVYLASSALQLWPTRTASFEAIPALKGTLFPLRPA